MITVCMLRGAGEHLNNKGSLLWQLAAKVDHLAPRRFEFVDVDYPASIGPVNPDGSMAGVSLAESRRIGIEATAAAVRATDSLVMLGGYSLGALVGSEFLAAQQRGDFPDCIVPWAFFVANPLRRAGDSWDAINAPGFGLAGQHGPWPDNLRHWEIAHPDDGITCTPTNSILRTVSDIIDPLSFALGGGWWQGLVEKTMRDEWQKILFTWRPGMPLPNPREFEFPFWRDAQLVDGYLRTGQHGPAYFERGYIDRIAAEIAREVR